MTQKVLFLCPHNAAKSVIAAAYFDQMAREAGLSLSSDSAGTEPDEVVSPVIAAMLQAEGFDVAGYKPRLLLPEELQTSTHIISIGCTPQELGGGEQIEYWDDVPLVSQDAEGARVAIHRHVVELVERLRVTAKQAK